jgi:hypothetical protein
MAMRIRTILILVLLVLLPALPARAQAPVTVTFRLTLAGSVGTDAGFSVLYYTGASHTATEAVFCGQALLFRHPAATPCRAQSAVYLQHVTVAAGTPVHFDVIQAAPAYGLIVSGTTTPSAATTISASYPHAASAVPVTFQLTVHIKLPRGVYVAVAYPYGGQHVLYGDLPLCSTVARPTDRAYVKRCLANGGSSVATIYLAPGTAGAAMFYAFRWGKPACLTSPPSAVHVAHTPIQIATSIITSLQGINACFFPPIVGGAGLQFD